MNQRKRIIWIKTKPPIKQIKEMAPAYDEIEIVNAPLGFFNALMSDFKYEVKVFSDRDDEAPLNKETYYQNYEAIEAISSNHTVHYIIIHNDERLVEAILR
jgi:DNA-binding LytR/AlgR family response regulator